MMRYNTITKFDVNNGPGFRVSLWLQGCDIKCPGCHNSELWNFDEGEPFTTKVLFKLIDDCNDTRISGLSILGGEPMSHVHIHDLKEMLHTLRSSIDSPFALLDYVHQAYPTMEIDWQTSPNPPTIWLYTGYTWEHFTDAQKEILPYLDVIVDGPYKESLRDTSLAFRGSSNQRIIDVQKSLEQDTVVLYEKGSQE